MLSRTAVAALLVCGPVLAGCDDGQESRGEQLVSVYEFGETADGPELHQVSVMPPEPDRDRSDFAAEARAAVDALLDHEPTPGHSNLWNGECAPGEDITDVRMTEKQTTIWLEGRNGTICDLTREASAIRAQQLVWTVLVNSKASGWRAPVVVHDGSGATWAPIVADDSYLPELPED